VVTKPRKVQKHVELWARFCECTDLTIAGTWNLYVADGNGILTGKAHFGSWDNMGFSRDEIVPYNGVIWRFLGELV